MVMSEGPLETWGSFYWRAVLFGLLCAFLYSYIPNTNCMTGQRGYLFCYLPVLMVSFNIVWPFFVFALIATAYGDTCVHTAWPTPVLAYYQEEESHIELI